MVLCEGNVCHSKVTNYVCQSLTIYLKRKAKKTIKWVGQSHHGDTKNMIFFMLAYIVSCGFKEVYFFAHFKRNIYNQTFFSSIAINFLHLPPTHHGENCYLWQFSLSPSIITVIDHYGHHDYRHRLLLTWIIIDIDYYWHWLLLTLIDHYRHDHYHHHYRHGPAGG